MQSHQDFDAKPRVYAFLDLDETLIDLAANHFNEALLQTLEEHDIKDLVLFTSMDARQIQSDDQAKLTRPYIVDRLKSRGFRVHMVVTPPDVYYDDPGFYYKYRWLPEYNRVQASKEDPETAKYKNEYELEMNKPQHERNNKRIEDLRKIPGVFVENIDDEHNKVLVSLDQQLSQELSKPQKNISLIESLRFQLNINKGRMFTTVLDHKDRFPGMIGVILAEDRPEEVELVAAANMQHDKRLMLSVIPIRRRDKGQDVLSDVPTDKTIDGYLERIDEIKKRYHNAMPISAKLSYLQYRLCSQPLLESKSSGIVKMRDLLNHMKPEDDPLMILLQLKQIVAEASLENNLFKVKGLKGAIKFVKERVSSQKENIDEFYEFVRKSPISPRAVELIDSDPAKRPDSKTKLDK